VETPPFRRSGHGFPGSPDGYPSAERATIRRAGRGGPFPRPATGRRGLSMSRVRFGLDQSRAFDQLPQRSGGTDIAGRDLSHLAHNRPRALDLGQRRRTPRLERRYLRPHPARVVVVTLIHPPRIKQATTTSAAPRLEPLQTTTATVRHRCSVDRRCPEVPDGAIRVPNDRDSALLEPLVGADRAQTRSAAASRRSAELRSAIACGLCCGGLLSPRLQPGDLRLPALVLRARTGPPVSGSIAATPPPESAVERRNTLCAM
jgi:hypothetical protein